jgi:hypothetical protein
MPFPSSKTEGRYLAKASIMHRFSGGQRAHEHGQSTRQLGDVAISHNRRGISFGEPKSRPL